jgi:hypothetical protein
LKLKRKEKLKKRLDLQSGYTHRRHVFQLKEGKTKNKNKNPEEII